jgi:hypothetical protein
MHTTPVLRKRGNDWGYENAYPPRPVFWVTVSEEEDRGYLCAQQYETKADKNGGLAS